MKMIRLVWLLAIGCFLVSCSDDDNTVPLCDCSPDQYCADSTCYDTNADIVPAPEDQSNVLKDKSN